MGLFDREGKWMVFIFVGLLLVAVIAGTLAPEIKSWLSPENSETSLSPEPYREPKVTQGSIFKRAWWLTIEYVPDATEIDSIGISQIHRDWKKVKVLRKNDYPDNEESEESTRATNSDSSPIEVVGDFNGDGKTDKALIGVYENQSGSFGKFLLVLSLDSEKTWTKVFLEEFPGKPGTAFIGKDSEKLIWSDCSECDFWMELEWDEDEEEYELVGVEFGE